MIWHTEPYLHGEGVGAFPPSLYSDMMKNLPKWGEMKVGPGPQYNLRRSWNYPECNELWRTAFEHLESQYPGEKLQIGLYLTSPGFWLLPHTDMLTKKETTVYYLTESEIPGIGTAIFKPRDPDLKSYQCEHYPYELFDLVKTASFVPNGWMTFQVSPVSFHGVLPCKYWRFAIYLTRYREVLDANQRTVSQTESRETHTR